MPTTLLIVRAEIPDPADRSHFDEWYQREHLPDAFAAVRPDRAWRCWSRIEPSSHYAFYEFRDLEAAQAALTSEAIKQLIREFDRVWGSRVTRTRDIVEVVQWLPQ
jgi:quinol monooxygenase YgiN